MSFSTESPFKNIVHFAKSLITIDVLSIKKLTLLGFTLVAIPLVLALLYSVKQVNLLANQGAVAIFDVAKLISVNRELNQSLIRTERYVSQFVVLKDQELQQQYQNEHQQLLLLLTDSERWPNDAELNLKINILSALARDVYPLIHPKNNTEIAPLEKIQSTFKNLSATSIEINEISIRLIDEQAQKIQSSADDVSGLMLKSLIIIPISLMIAAIFIFLITKPLKLLTKKIQRLEQGKFDQKITIKGSPEIREIAEALDIMRTRLHALELQKSSFIRHISHELKTPLAAIREGTELLYDNSVGELNTEQQEISNIIRGSVTRLQKLIEDLLDFNIVLDSNSLQDLEKISLLPVVKEVLDERKLDIKRKNLTIATEVSNIGVQTNAKQLHVILDNLLSNAIKYSPDNGTINVKATMDKSQLLLTVSDHGEGIDSDIQPNIFDAFYQGKAPQNSVIKGSGLGLTIVKELVMRLNGSIHLFSQTIMPSGTTVSVQLPKAFYLGKSK